MSEENYPELATNPYILRFDNELFFNIPALKRTFGDDTQRIYNILYFVAHLFENNPYRYHNINTNAQKELPYRENGKYRYIKIDAAEFCDFCNYDKKNLMRKSELPEYLREIIPDFDRKWYHIEKYSRDELYSYIIKNNKLENVKKAINKLKNKDDRKQEMKILIKIAQNIFVDDCIEKLKLENNGIINFDTILDNSFYKLASKVVMDFKQRPGSKYDITDVGGLRIANHVRKCTDRSKKGKVFYLLQISKEYESNLDGLFAPKDTSILPVLNKKNLDGLDNHIIYKYYKASRENNNKIDTEFNILKEILDINTVEPKDAKYLINKKVTDHQRVSKIKYEFIWEKSGKMKEDYQPFFKFNQLMPKEQLNRLRNKAFANNLNHELIELFKTINSYFEKFDYEEWLYDIKQNKKAKTDIFNKLFDNYYPGASRPIRNSNFHTFYKQKLADAI